MSVHASHAGGHEADLGFGRVLVIVPVSMGILVLYVAICWLGASTSLKSEMTRKQAQTADAGVNNGTSP